MLKNKVLLIKVLFETLVCVLEKTFDSVKKIKKFKQNTRTIKNLI